MDDNSKLESDRGLERELSWSGTEYELSNFLELFILPQVVQVAEGNYGVREETTLPAEQILTLHTLKNTTMFRGYTYDDRTEVFLPVNNPQKVEIRLQNVSLIYECVRELCTVLNRVKYVRVTKSHIDTEHAERCVEAGQKLCLHYIDNKGSAQQALICTDEEGRELCLPMNIVGGFQPVLNNQEYFLMEVMEMFSLPLYVQFTKGSNTHDLIQLHDIIIDETVIASTKDGDKKTILTFPKDLDVSVIVCKEALTNDETYARVCASLNDGVDLVKAEKVAVTNQDILYGRPQFVREFSYNSLAAKQCQRESGQLLETNTRTSSLSRTSNIKETPVEDTDDDNSGIYEEIDEDYVKSSLKRKANQRKYGEQTKGYVKMLPTDKLLNETKNCDQTDLQDHDYEDADIISVIKEAKATQEDSSDSDGEYYVPIATRAPGADNKNSQVASQITEDPDSPNDVYSMEVHEMNVKEVGLLLRELNMSEYEELFEEQQVNGSMLKHLDREILQSTPFNMAPFHALKLIKAAEEHWRPNVN